MTIQEGRSHGSSVSKDRFDSCRYTMRAMASTWSMVTQHPARPVRTADCRCRTLKVLDELLDEVSLQLRR